MLHDFEMFFKQALVIFFVMGTLNCSFKDILLNRRLQRLGGSATPSHFSFFLGGGKQHFFILPTCDALVISRHSRLTG